MIPLPAGSRPTRLAVGADGAIWVTMFGADAIDRFAGDGSRRRFPLPFGSGPLDLTVGPDGAIWFTEYGTDRIGRLAADGALAELPIPTSKSRPLGIVTGPDGALWFAESEAGALGRLFPPREPEGGGGPSSPDLTAPRFTDRPAFRPRRFVPRGVGDGRGTTLRFGLSEPAVVTVAFAPVRGRGGGRRPATLRRSFAAGPARLRFSGRLGGHPLAPGRHRARVGAVDAAGNASRTLTVGFRVLRPLPPR